MSGITLSEAEMKHYSIDKNQVLSRRKSLILNEPRIFIILCSVTEAEKIVEDHNLVLASPSRYNSGGRSVFTKMTNKGRVLGPVFGFRQVPK